MTAEIMSSDETRTMLETRANLVENFLLSFYRQKRDSIPERLFAAMTYSLEAGGKRLRPVLFLTCASLCGAKLESILPFAGAIEMIHTYSLIHDDLPAMDNDDFRRGKPSSHKAFDEATAILAGDGLLTDAFSLMSTTSASCDSLLCAMRNISEAAGSTGMVGGQMLDMEYTGAMNITEQQLEDMQAAKTGAMIRSSCECGAILGQAPENIQKRIAEYGTSLGLAFQIIDDILDITSTSEKLGKPAGSDEKAGKNTWPKVFGLDESLNRAKIECDKALKILDGFTGKDAAFLRGLTAFIIGRHA